MNSRYILSVKPDEGLSLVGKNYKGQPIGWEEFLAVESPKEKMRITPESSLNMASGTIRAKGVLGNCPGS